MPRAAERRLQGPREPALPRRDPRRRRPHRRRPRDVQVVARQRHGRHARHRDPGARPASSSRASAATRCSASRTATGSRSPTTCASSPACPARCAASRPAAASTRRRGRSASTAPCRPGAFPTDAQGQTTPARNTRIRRWDQHGRVVNAGGNLLVDLDAAGSTGTIPVAAGPTKIAARARRRRRPSASTAGGRFRTGDHWVFAARTADASVEELDARAAARRPRPLREARARHLPGRRDRLPDALAAARRRTAAATARSASRRSRTPAARSRSTQRSSRSSRRGGTVCLAAGRVRAAPSRSRSTTRGRCGCAGRAWRRCLSRRRSGTAIDVRRSIAVTVENLVGRHRRRRSGADAIRLERCLDATLRRCFVLNLAGERRRQGGPRCGSPAMLIGAVHRGVRAGAPRPASPEDVRGRRRTCSSPPRCASTSNWLWCDASAASTSARSPSTWPARGSPATRSGAAARRASSPAGGSAAGAVRRRATTLSTSRAAASSRGVDAAADRRQRRPRRRRATASSLVGGLDPGAIDHCRVTRQPRRRVRRRRASRSRGRVATAR